MSGLDTEELELLTPSVTNQLQAFNNQVVAHLKNYKPETARIYGRIDDLGAADVRLEGQIKAVQAEVAAHYDQNVSAYGGLGERLARLEQLMNALPAWKEDLLTRIDGLGRETRAKHEAASSRVTVLEGNHEAHVQGTRERLDMLTSVAKTASEARAQQQERIDELDTSLRRHRDATEAALADGRVHRRRLDEEMLLARGKLAEHTAGLAEQQLALGRLREGEVQHGRSIEELFRGLDNLSQTTMGVGQEMSLVKRGLGAVEATAGSLVTRLGALDAEVQGRLLALEGHRNALFEWKDATVGSLERMGREKELLLDRVNMLDAKVEAGPPGLWKMAAQVAAHEEELATSRTALSAAKATGDELGRRLDDAMSGLAHQRDTAAQLREECRMLAERLSSETARGRSYVDDRLEPLARRYELEALRKSCEAGLERLQSALAGSGERLKFELLHGEAAQVGSIREYMADVERRNGALAERLAALEAGLSGEAERGRSVAASTRELRAAMDGLLSTGQSDLAQLRATISGLHEEYAELSKRAARSGLLTAAAVEELVDARLHGPVMDALLTKKMARHEAYTRTNSLAPAASFSAGSGSFSAGAGGGGLEHLRSKSMAAHGGSPLSRPPGLPTNSEPSYGGAGGAEEADGGGRRGGGGGGGGGGEPDPELGLRLVAVESDVSRLLEAFKSLGGRVAPLSDLDELRDQLRALGQAVARGALGQALLGEPGEEAVRRHVHATLLPELLERQAADSRRVMGWMDEQLGDMAREVAALRRGSEQLAAQLAALVAAQQQQQGQQQGQQGHPGHSGSGEQQQQQQQQQQQLGSPRLSASMRQRSARLPLGGGGAGPAVMEGGGGGGGGGGMTGPEAAALVSQVGELTEQLAALSELLGVPLLKNSARVAGAGAAAAARFGSANGMQPAPLAARAPPAGEASTTEGASASGQQQGLGDSEANVSYDGTSAPGPAPEHSGGSGGAGGSSGGGGGVEAGGFTLGARSPPDAHAVTVRGLALEGLSLSLPSLVQRLQQLEASVHSLAAGQRAVQAAAAAAGGLGGGAAGAAGLLGQLLPEGSSSSQGALAPSFGGTPRGQESGGVGSSTAALQGGAAAAAAVQGLVDAAVSELRLRLRLLEQELPLLARSFEVKALRRLMQDYAAAASTAVAGAAAAGVMLGGDVLAAAGGGGGGANRSNRIASAGRGGPAAAAEMPLSKRLSSLELALATMDERGRALEERWAAQEARWGAAMAEAQAALPRLQTAVAQLSRETAAVRSGAGSGGGGGWGGGYGATDDDGVPLRGGGSTGGGAAGRRGAAGGGGGGGGGFAGPGMAEVVNVELAGIAHDLALAAHEELRRTRDGPLPDGTQEGAATPAATAAREAALARLRRKPREVAAHVELLEGVKLHLDRLVRRHTNCTVDRLVLLAAMGGMRLKLLENEVESFREQIVAVFRSLERAFQALVQLQDAVASKGSAAAVSQLALMLQDVSGGLAVLAAHSAARDVLPGAAPSPGARGRRANSQGSDFGAAPQSPLTLLQAPGSPGAAPSTPGGAGQSPAEEALAALLAGAGGGSGGGAGRTPSPNAVARPGSPSRIAGPGVNTALHRQQAAAARGRLMSAGPGGPQHQQQPQPAWPPPKPSAVSVPASPAYVPAAAAASPAVSTAPASGAGGGGGGSGAPGSPMFPHKSQSAGVGVAGGGVVLSPAGAGASASAAGGGGRAGTPELAWANGDSAAGGGASGGPGNRVWSARRPGSAVAHGLHMGVGSPAGGGGGAASRLGGAGGQAQGLGLGLGLVPNGTVAGGGNASNLPYIGGGGGGGSGRVPSARPMPGGGGPYGYG